MRRSALVLAAFGIAGATIAAAPAAFAQQPTLSPVFEPANATSTAQAAPNAADVTKDFDGFHYKLDPSCFAQTYVTATREAQDPNTGVVVEYATTTTFLKYGSDFVPEPQGENLATGAIVGKPVGARLCVGVEGAQ